LTAKIREVHLAAATRMAHRPTQLGQTVLQGEAT